MEQRIDPDEILKQIVKSSFGRHKLYLGMAPGVGKTYRMMEDAYEIKKSGVDIVIGYIETQERSTNESLIKQFQIIPKKKYVINNNDFFELDLEAILERKPACVVIDELAHTNMPGSLNKKRYEDVQELLQKGISILSTLNVHQIESIAPIVEKNIGVNITETVPDWVINQVDELIVVDIPIDELYKRLEEKNIYGKTQMKHAMKNFFRKNNLLLLRDLSLNFLAEKIDRQVVSEKLKTKIKERILVAASPQLNSIKLIEHASEISKTTHSSIDVACIINKDEVMDEKIINILRETTRDLTGNFFLIKNNNLSIHEELIQLIELNRITLLILGHTKTERWFDLLQEPITFKILKKTTNIDILIIGKKEKKILPQIDNEPTFQASTNPKLGKLKIYIGMAPGVGKTYKMLQEAQEYYKENKNIFLGVIDTHGRVDTATIMEGLPLLPPKIIKHQGKFLQEFDLETAILKKPEIIYVDELAHSNVPGSINNKRYQDVQYLLRAGINVATTVNIKHIESLNDLVEQFSGIKVRETVPDWIISHANDIILVDISPEALQERLKKGKVYSLDKIEQALEHFFQRKNLIALRELSLREVAENVEHEMHPKEKLTKIVSVIDINDNTLRLIRKSARIANRLHGEFIVLHIVKDTKKLMEERKLSIIELEELVVELGGDFRLIESKNETKELINLEQKIKPDYIIIGEPAKGSGLTLLKDIETKEIINKITDANIWIVGNYTKET